MNREYLPKQKNYSYKKNSVIQNKDAQSKKIIIPLLSTTLSLRKYTIEQSIENTQTLKIINGVLTLHPHDSMMYSAFVQNISLRRIGLSSQANNPLVSVRAFVDNGLSKCPIFLPVEYVSQFPESLPLSLLRGKKDGDKLEFMIGEKRKIILTSTKKAVTSLIHLKDCCHI